MFCIYIRYILSFLFYIIYIDSKKKNLQIFTKYEQHRRLLLDDILASIARIPSTKRNLRSYRLNSEQHIQMLTALVLQLIQCVVVLPDNLDKSDKDKPEKGDEQSTSKMSQVYLMLLFFYFEFTIDYYKYFLIFTGR